MRMLEILWIVLFRFRATARVWAICLILINLAALLFLDSYYAWVNLIATALGISIMMLIYTRLGFVRLLGIGHIFWIPMIIWFLYDLPNRHTDPALYGWVVLLILVNSISAIIDAVDVARFVRGERSPHYLW